MHVLIQAKIYICLMAIRTKHEIIQHTWFITFTWYKWIPLFEITQGQDLVYKWLKLIDQKYHIKTCGFVIMPNHVHLLMYIPNAEININTLIGNAKRFMAYDFINHLKYYNNHGLLSTLAASCTNQEKIKGQLHKAFEPSFDAKPVYSVKFLNQKLDYIHHNPVSGKWSLVEDLTDYMHSSAAWYYLERPHPYIDIVDYRHYWL